MAEFHFRSMEASQKKTDFTIQFLVGGLVIHFVAILCLPCSVQKLFKNFMFVQWLKIFLIFEENLTSEIFVANLDTPKRHYSQKSASIDEFWSRWLLPFGL
jgi:hypothetical protein